MSSFDKICNPYLASAEKDFYFSVKDMAREKIYPSVLERDRKAEWSPEIWQELARTQLTGITIDTKYGGQGGTCLQSSQAYEAMYAGCGDGGLGLSLAAHSVIGAMPIQLNGSEEQKQEYLPPLAAGEKIAALALTEAGAGSDNAAMLSFAEDCKDHFLLNGNKMLITNGSIADIFIVLARTKKGKSSLGISAFIVEKDFPGFSVGNVLKKMGHRSSPTTEIIFDNVRVPKKNLLGPLHSGFLRVGRSTLEYERIILIAGFLGGVEFVLEKSLLYSQERQQFSVPIKSFLPIKEKITKLWLYLQACRRFIYSISSRKDAGENLSLESSLAKLFISELCQEAAAEGCTNTWRLWLY